MEDDFIDGSSNKKPEGPNVTRNVLLGLAGIFFIAFLILIILSLTGGQYGIIVGLIFGIWSVPIQCILLGIIFFIAKKKTEGGVMLIIGFVLLLIGVVVCGSMMF